MVGQATPTSDNPMEVDSENPIPNLNSQSDSSSREKIEAATHQDTARADLVAQAQETLLKSRFYLIHTLSLSLAGTIERWATLFCYLLRVFVIVFVHKQTT